MGVAVVDVEDVLRGKEAKSIPKSNPDRLEGEGMELSSMGGKPGKWCLLSPIPTGNACRGELRI